MTSHLRGNVHCQDIGSNTITFDADHGRDKFDMVCSEFLVNGTPIALIGTCLQLGDNIPICFGDDEDMTIKHSGTNNIVNVANGSLFFVMTDEDKVFCVDLPDTGSTSAFTVRDGGFSGKFQVKANGVINFGSAGNVNYDGVDTLNFLDSKLCTFGTGNDITISHDGSDAKITNDTGSILFTNTDTVSEYIFQLGTQTTDTDFRVTDSLGGKVFVVYGEGTIDFTNGLYWDTTELGFDYNKSVAFGDAGDFVIQHDGTDSTLVNAKGHLFVKVTEADKDIFNTLASGSSTFKVANSSNVTKFEVSSSGDIVTQKGTVTQATSHVTAVTLNEPAGVITMANSALGAEITVAFTVNNTKVLSGSIILVSILDYSGSWGTNGFPVVAVDNIVNATSFDIRLYNAHSSNNMSGVLKVAFQIL